MSEGMVKRISRIISASANAIVDSIEDSAPQLVMEQAIREIDSAADEVRTQLGKVEAAKYLSSKALNTENTKHQELQANIDVAINLNRDDLAEAAISKQMDIEAQLPILEKSIEDADAEIAELSSYISALQGKKREMQEQLKEYVKAAEHITNEDKCGTSSNTAKKAEQANDAFNRMLEKGGLPVSNSQADDKKLAELDELSRKNRIQERLAKVKSDAEA